MSLHPSRSIAQAFSRNATAYDAHATVQTFAAGELAKLIRHRCSTNFSGPIIEIGCGTGLLSEQILRLFPEHQISLLDISETMIAQAQSKLSKNFDLASSRVKFFVADAETFFHSSEGQKCPPPYSLIVSSSTFQWFKDPANTISELITHLDSGGYLMFSTPAAGSFTEWQSMTNRLDLPCTANPLPSTDTFLSIAHQGGCTLKMEELQFEEQYDHALNFFLSLKQLGATTSILSTKCSLSAAQLRRLIRYWNDQTQNCIKITYRIIQGCFSK